MKIKNYRYDGSDEEKTLQFLRDMHHEVEYKNKQINIREFSFLMNEVRKGEDAKKLINEISNIKENEKVYDVWFYYEPDIGNNGGVRTTLKKSELENLINIGNKMTNVYFVHIYDIFESFKNKEKVIPDWISNEIKEQLNNSEFNYWHKSLLNKS